MATYQEIKQANEAVQSMTIEREDKKNGKIISKEYVEVNQRIKAFRMVYPNGSITTEIIGLSDGIVTMKAVVADELGTLLGTGHAQEKEESSFINKTSYIENCETSAVGRALGMCGFGIDTSVASYEEVANAINNQEVPKATPNQIAWLQKAYTGKNLTTLLQMNNIEKLEDMPKDKASELISKLQRKG